jgi:hypothetical protein
MTTIAIPDSLAEQVRQRSRVRGVSFEETFADCLRIGLAAIPLAPKVLEKPRVERDPQTGCPKIVNAKPAAATLVKPSIERDDLTGLPIIVGGHAAAPGNELTPEVAAQILLDQEVQAFLDLGR